MDYDSGEYRRPIASKKENPKLEKVNGKKPRGDRNYDDADSKRMLFVSVSF